MKNTVCPIWEVPEVKQKVAYVKQNIYRTLAAKNLYAWRTFVEELQSDIEAEIYKYEELHRQGKYKETKTGGYCHMAMQGAMNYVAYYKAQKRVLNYEALSLDALIETEDGGIPFQLAEPESFTDSTELLMAIGQQMGPEAESIAQRVLDGCSVSKAELNKLRKPELLELLHNY